ncbi:MAG: hypothetical protein ACR2KZ_05115 [Segetibacter sp.]
MFSFEQEYKTFLESQQINYKDNCNSYKLLDFTLINLVNNRNLYVDVKEKRQVINTKNWPSIDASNEKFTFIMDDLAARKIFAYAPYSGLIIRDNITTTYYWYSIIDLGLMPKIRVNRAIEKYRLQYKGKWIVDFRNAASANSLEDISKIILQYAEAIVQMCTEFIPCYGNYHNEKLSIEGEIRNQGHWDIDVKETR